MSIQITNNTKDVSVTDNVLVTGYLLSESSLTPAIDAAGWSATKQTTYHFSTVGSKTLYAWAKDAAGNISLSDNDIYYNNYTTKQLTCFWGRYTSMEILIY